MPDITLRELLMEVNKIRPILQNCTRPALNSNHSKCILVMKIIQHTSVKHSDYKFYHVFSSQYTKSQYDMSSDSLKSLKKYRHPKIKEQFIQVEELNAIFIYRLLQ